MPSAAARIVPPWMRGYKKEWLSRDLVAGATLAAVAIPECMGYTSIAQTPDRDRPVHDHLPDDWLFALLGSSRLLVVGADSATAALLAAGLGGAAISGVTPGSPEWLAYTSIIALICGGFLLIARIFRLGFLGDFLSASVLIGFLTGVGVQVLTGQIPDILGIPKGTGTWIQQQWDMLTSLGEISWPTFAYGLGTILIITGFKRFIPKVPGAIIAVVLFIVVSTMLDSSANGVAVVGAVQGGFPPIGLPQGITLDDVTSNMATLLAIGFSCFVLIIAQSAATSRSFAMKHGQPVDVNRDIVGLSGANVAAGLSGTFVVNGSPTKTQILDEQKGITQLANITMSGITLLVVLFFTAALTNMPKAVLGGIVFLIGVSLVDIAGLREIAKVRKGEFVIAVVTAVVVCAVGVEQGIILAIVVSILNIIRLPVPAEGLPRRRRRGRAADLHAGHSRDAERARAHHLPVRRGAVLREREPLRRRRRGAGRVRLPTPVEWLIVDASSIDDVDYSGGTRAERAARLPGRQGHHDRDSPGSIRASSATLDSHGLAERIPADMRFGNLIDAYSAFTRRARSATS